MPRLLQQLAEEAPGVKIAIRHLSPGLPAEALDQGELDLVLGRFHSIPTRFVSQRWMSETLRLVARRDHPAVQQTPDLAGFLRLRHLWVHGGQTKGMVDQWLGEQGLARDIVYTTPNYLQAAHIVADTDLTVVLPTRLAQHFARLLPLQVHPLPFALDPFHLDLVSVAQREGDEALQWLVERLLVIGRT
ncbi:PCP degradation transcriptional activation protein [compost metagenome]